MTLNYTSSAANKRGIISAGSQIQYETKPMVSKGLGCLIGILAIVLLVTSIIMLMAL
jgi:hypothetical protein